VDIASVTKIVFSLHSYPIVVPFSIALESLPEATIVIIQCIDAEGRVGIGEAAPFPTLTYDSTEIVVSCLEEVIIELDGFNPTDALLALKNRADYWRQKSVTAYCGIESALLDLLAKQKGVSLHALYGTANVTLVETDITVPIMPLEHVSNFFAIFSLFGFRTIKIKVSGNVSYDRDFIHTVYDHCPKGTIFTLDGNQGFNVETARSLVAKLNADGIHPAFFEQPLAEQDWGGLWDLAKTIDTVICLDEAIRTTSDLRKLINEAGPDLKRFMINLKIMKSGICETVDLIEIATDFCIPMMIGGMLESEIAMSHSLHVACGKGGIEYFDLDTPYFFRSSPAKSSPWTQRSSMLARPNGIGLGLDLV